MFGLSIGGQLASSSDLQGVYSYFLNLSVILFLPLMVEFANGTIWMLNSFCGEILLLLESMSSFRVGLLDVSIFSSPFC